MDGLERDLAGQARVLRLDILGPTGQAVARDRNVELVPTFLVIDGQGREAAPLRGVDAGGLKRAVGRPSRSKVWISSGRSRAGWRSRLPISGTFAWIRRSLRAGGMA